MKKIIVLILICISFLSYGQSDTSEYRLYFQVYPTEHYEISSDEIYDFGYSKSKRLTFKPIINLTITDSINKLRIKKGVRPILYDTIRLTEKLFTSHMDVAKLKAEKFDNVFFVQDNDTTSNCECAQSIFEYITDDSLIFSKAKLFGKEKDYVFRDILADRRISEIQVVYFQFRMNRSEIQESLYVYIRKRFSLITSEYRIIVDRPK